MGMRSNEDADTLAVSFSQESAALTKKGTLNKVAKVYDALGRASPTILERKFLYRSTSQENTFQERKAWDAELPQELAKHWKKWETNVPEKVELPRCFSLHAFGDASSQGVVVAVYAMVEQETGMKQGLEAPKARLA